SSLFEELERWNSDAFLENIGSIGGNGAGSHAAHVLVMSDGGADRDRAPLEEDWHHHGDVGKMRSSGVRVVKNERVAFPQCIEGKGLEQLSDHRNEGGEVIGYGDRLRERLAFNGEQARRRVPRLLYDLRE